MDRNTIDELKQRLNLLDIIGTDVVWIKTAGNYGGTYKGPCPFCGGTDRFHAHPAAGNWWCRQCQRKGDSIKYWMDRYNVSFTEACQALSLVVGLSGLSDKPVKPAPTESTEQWIDPDVTRAFKAALPATEADGGIDWPYGLYHPGRGVLVAFGSLAEIEAATMPGEGDKSSILLLSNPGTV